jgi:hypothetical protein
MIMIILNTSRVWGASRAPITIWGRRDGFKDISVYLWLCQRNASG